MLFRSLRRLVDTYNDKTDCGFSGPDFVSDHKQESLIHDGVFWAVCQRRPKTHFDLLQTREMYCFFHSMHSSWHNAPQPLKVFQGGWVLYAISG